MTEVGIRELRQNLSKYLRRVGRGESFRVLDRGRPVASLGPLPEEASTVDRLAARGVLSRARRDLLQLGEPPKAPGARSISESLREQRAEAEG